MKQDIHDLVLKEARLLDEWRLDEWLGLYAADARYWLPIDENASPDAVTSLVYETRQILELRVEQLARQARPSQTPRSELMRTISNLEIDADDLSARFCLLAVEVRSGDWRQRGLGEKRLFAGRCLMRVRAEADGLRIVHKQIVLLDRRQPIEGLSFIL
jgi:3-phenylpropionate/cinnamic acid dioxygenase small subunit